MTIPTPSTLAPIAIITGGSRGLGKNTALHLARRGTDVILTYRSQRDQALAVVAQIEALGRRAVALPLDVGVSVGMADSFAAFAEAVRQALAAHWQRDSFNYLVNNAGAGVHASLMETTEAQFDDLVNMHFNGVLADKGTWVIATNIDGFDWLGLGSSIDHTLCGGGCCCNR